MLEDVGAGSTLSPAEPDPDDAERLVRQRRPDYIAYADWLRLDELEIARGQSRGCPRVKFTRVHEMLAALGNRNRS
jgi:hypothetical protein